MDPEINEMVTVTVQSVSSWLGAIVTLNDYDKDGYIEPCRCSRILEVGEEARCIVIEIVDHGKRADLSLV